ncbi:MAG: hypothetical protein EON54_22695 [Alcaligenaceae bacterium]|nr:MAG: hypothetical protein EON54_22695 [Alcaligenaceae bacterium]
MSDTDRVKLSAFIREEFMLGSRPTLTSTVVGQVVGRPALPVNDRLEKLLRWAVARQRTVDDIFNIGEPELVAHTHSKTTREVIALNGYLEQRGLVRKITMDGNYQVTIDGFMEASSHQSGTGSRTAFIAMWFDPQMDDARNIGLIPAIAAAGYTPIIVNSVEYINKIDDEIVAQIRRSRFLVADFTGHRGGVYFEAGFAMGLGLPVFWTCREDALPDLHFDIRQYNCIVWQDPAELALRLQRRIEAVMGVGPVAMGA